MLHPLHSRGATLTGALASAEHSRIQQYREEGEALARKYIAELTARR